MRQLVCITLLLLSLAEPAWADKTVRVILTHTDRQEWQEAIRKAGLHGYASLEPFIRWRRYRGIDDRPAAEEILTFIEKYPHWPEVARLLDRAAEALLLQGMHENALYKWRQLAQKHDHPAAQKKDKTALLRHYWRTGEFNAAEQDKILSRYSDNLNEKDHIARVDALLWKERTARAKGLFKLIPAAHRRLSQARIALYSNQHGVDAAIRAVPKALRNHPALLYERIRWRARKQRHDGVRELLLQTQKSLPYPEKWWKYRARQARDAMESGDYKLALKLLQKQAQRDGAPLAEALWMRGWLQLEFLSDPKAAYKDFYQLYHHVSYPISLSRGAYWAAMAAERNGNRDIAQNWYQLAASHPTHFYGQLAQLSQPKFGHLSLQETAVAGRGSSPLRDAEADILTLLPLLAAEEKDYWVRFFIRHLARKQQKPREFLKLADFATTLGYPQLSLYVGKRASQLHHYRLFTISHPLYDLQGLGELPIEPALALAIMRQESAFNPQARSSANAIGMMQLLPGTAKLTARKLGIRYEYRKLTDADYNIRLGSHYLASLLEQFNGSYPLAIAAYNAGPGNVKRWIERFGTPDETLSGTLRWLEMIPFHETRNYVQRVLENLQVYRSLRGEKRPFTQKRAFAGQDKES